MKLLVRGNFGHRAGRGARQFLPRDEMTRRRPWIFRGRIARWQVHQALTWKPKAVQTAPPSAAGRRCRRYNRRMAHSPPRLQDWRRTGLLTLGLLALVALAGCSREPSGHSSRRELSVWVHAGREAERSTFQRQVQRFNRSQHDLEVTLTWIPEGSYNGQVQAAALAGRLPDVLEIDGPFVASYAWQGALVPLDGLMPQSLRAQLLPSILAQGSWQDTWYAVGSFDSGLGLWADRRALERVGARMPQTPAEAWTAAEFHELLATLARRDADGAVLDLKLNYPDEWLTYAFLPLLVSAGGDLIDRNTYRSAAGVLNGAAAVSVLREVQSWFELGYVDPNLDDAAFSTGRVALALGGHWNYPRYHAALGEHLVLLPLPRFGARSATDSGSWTWAITTHCMHPEAAARFVAFLLQPQEVLAMTAANGAVPATRAALAQCADYRSGGALHLFSVQLAEGYAVPRPRTPAYPVISSAFAAAFRAVRSGTDVRQALDRAATVIDRDLADNHGYPPLARKRAPQTWRAQARP